METYFKIVLFFFVMNFFTPEEKFYKREFYETGILKAEGWRKRNSRVDHWIFNYPDGKIWRKGHFRDNEMHGYWYFYAENKKLLKEGHYFLGKAENWWIFFEGTRSKKVQYRNDKKEGFALCYNNRKLEKVEKYFNDTKLDEWTDVYSFKLDNPEVKF